MFDLWSLEPKMFGKWSEIYSFNVTKFKLNIYYFFLKDLTYKCFARTVFSNMHKLNAILTVYLTVSQHNGLFSGYIKNIVLCGRHIVFGVFHPNREFFGRKGNYTCVPLTYWIRLVEKKWLITIVFK